MYSTNTITGNSSFGCFVIVLHCVPFIMYQAAKSSENATEIWKYGGLAYVLQLKFWRLGVIIPISSQIPLHSSSHSIRPTQISHIHITNQPSKQKAVTTDPLKQVWSWHKQLLWIEIPLQKKSQWFPVLSFSIYRKSEQITGLLKTNICHGQNQIMKNAPHPHSFHNSNPQQLMECRDQ